MAAPAVAEANDTDEINQSGLSLALTPVQLYAMLNGKNISQGELASNTWHEMPMPMGPAIERFLATLPEPPDPRQAAWNQQSHISQPTPPSCWIPPRVRPLDPAAANRASAVLQIIGGTVETIGGALLILAPDPTLLTKVGGSALALHGVDTTQAAMRQLFSGKPVEDYTQMGATWAARQAGASDATATRIGVILDVAVPFVAMAGIAAERVIAIRAGRVILAEETISAEESVAGKQGRVSVSGEEEDLRAGKEGGHTLREHVGASNQSLEAKAYAARNPAAVASRFASREIAEDAINDAIRANRTAIQQWASSPPGSTKGFNFDCSKVIGDGFFRASAQYQPMNKVRVVFKIAQSGGKRLYLFTAYPIP